MCVPSAAVEPPHFINGGKTLVLWYAPTDVQAEKVVDIPIGLQTSLDHEKITLHCTGGVFKDTKSDQCEFTTKGRNEGEAFQTHFTPNKDAQSLTAPCHLQALRGKQVIGETEIRIHQLTTIEIIDSTTSVAADGHQTGEVAAVLKDQHGKAMSSMPALMICTMPDNSRRVTASSSDATGTAVFVLPPSAKAGTIKAHIISGTVSSQLISVNYLNSPSVGLTATISVQRNVNINTEQLVPVIVAVTGQGETPIPATVLLMSNYGIFEESQKSEQMVTLEDGVGQANLRFPEWIRRASVIFTAYVENDRHHPLGQAMMTASFPDKIDGDFLQAEEGDVGALPAFQGRAHIRITDQYGRPMQGSPMYAFMHYPERVFMYGTTDMDGSVMWPLFIKSAVTESYIYTIGYGYAIRYPYCPFNFNFTFDKNGRIVKWTTTNTHN
jgi:hypothetical protein